MEKNQRERESQDIGESQDMERGHPLTWHHSLKQVHHFSGLLFVSKVKIKSVTGFLDLES